MQGVIYFFILIFLLSGCQKKQTAPLRCLYDQVEITEACQRAIQNEAAYARFKSDPFYALLYQSFSREEGVEILAHLERERPEFLKLCDRFRESDALGSPQTYDYGKYGHFSPTTLHHIFIAAEIQEKIGFSPSAHILQIGGGYGGLCKILHDRGAWERYTIVDLPQHLALARKTLEKQGITNVCFQTPEDFSPCTQYDMVISDLSFSEFARSTQKRWIATLVPRARSGLLFCHLFPKHFGVEPFSPEELKEALAKKIPSVAMSDVKGERAHYSIWWKSL